MSRVSSSTEVVQADCLDRTSLALALEGVDTAYYLVHSMGSSGQFEDEDRQAARNFADAAREQGVRRIIYLGGLGNQDQALSAHLRSRHEVADILRGSGVPTIEFRASIVIGSGSLSFEMIRALVQRLPVMICPQWVEIKAQPIAIEDVVAYLVAALELRLEGSAVFEIGGPDQVSYGEIMQEYARQCGLRRWMIPVPVLTPRLSSLWLGLVTPIYARVGRKLIESMRNPTLVCDPSALTTFGIKPKGLRESIERALHHENREFAADLLVRCSLLRWEDPIVGWCAVWDQAGRFPNHTSVRSTGLGLCPNPADWRLERMVLRHFPVASSRLLRSSYWRCGTAPGPPGSSCGGHWRCSGFLAGREL